MHEEENENLCESPDKLSKRLYTFLEKKFQNLSSAYDKYDQLFDKYPPEMFEIRDRQKRQEEEYRREHPDAPMPKKQTMIEKYVQEFLPPPSPEPEPEPEPEPVKEIMAEKVEPASKQAPPTTLETTPATEQQAVSPPGPAKAAPITSPESTPSKASFSPLASPKSPASPADEKHEGVLVRKHEWESLGKKASHRSWDKVFCVLHSQRLSFYKDQKHYRADSNSRFKNEPPMSLSGASAAVATDYTKRTHVFRLKLASGSDYLLNAKDDDDMNTWIGKINAAVTPGSASTPSKSQTMPASSSAEKSESRKSGRFPTLGRKK